MMLLKNALSPLHFLCSNERCSVDLLTDFFSFDKANSSCATVDAVSLFDTLRLSVATDKLLVIAKPSSERRHYICFV
jgi:hypothetical protein